MEALAQLLGGDLRALATGYQRGEAEGGADAAGYACLWRTRADLLARAVHVARTRQQRVRLNRLSRQLLEVAAVHPNAQEFVRNGRLLSLAEIAEETPRAVWQLVAAELAVMKLDAPVVVGLDRKGVLACFDLLLENLGEEARVDEVHEALSRTSLRSTPKWQELACVGDALGTAQRARSRAGRFP